MPSVAFLGGRPHGTRCLELLSDHDAFDVRAVVAPDPETETWWDGSLYERATLLGHDAFACEDATAVLDRDIDYLLNVSYPERVDEALLDHPRIAPLTLRLSELPRYSGYNCIAHAIMNARPDDHWRYGTTLHVSESEPDAGDVVARNFVPIRETDAARTLYERVTDAAVAMFREHLPTLCDGEVHRLATPQTAYSGPRYHYAPDSLDDERAVPLDRLTADDETAQLRAYDTIRALDFPPFEPAYTDLGGRQVHLTVSTYADLVDVSSLPVETEGTVERPAASLAGF